MTMPHVIRSTRPAPAYRTLRTGRTVYGGGGIRPDILVEADTVGFSNYYGELIRRGIVADFVGDWLDGSRDSLSRRYASFEAFDAGYTPSDEVLERLTALGESRGVKFDAEGFAVSEPLVRMQLKALAAQRLFGTGAYFRVINPAEAPPTPGPWRFSKIGTNRASGSGTVGK